MEPKDFTAVIELLLEFLGPEGFGEFKNTLRQELEESEETKRLKKEIQSYRVSIAKLETHIRRVLAYYNIPLEKGLEPKSEPSLNQPPPAPAATPESTPPAPPQISSFPPIVTNAILSHKRPKKSQTAEVVVPSQKESALVKRKIEECLRKAPGRTVRVSEIFFYLEEVARLPVTSSRWQWKGKSGRSRLQTVVYNHLQVLRVRGICRKEGEYWCWVGFLKGKKG